MRLGGKTSRFCLILHIHIQSAKTAFIRARNMRARAIRGFNPATPLALSDNMVKPIPAINPLS